MYVVPRRVSEAQAAGWFRKRGYGLAGRVLRPFFPGSRLPGSTLPRLELIWMPHYLYTIHAKARDGSEGRLEMTVDAYAGVFMLVELAGALDEVESLETAFPPCLSMEESEAQGREQLTWALMRRRGRRDKPMPLETLACQPFYYPFWTYYYERLPGAIDIAVLDAAAGEKAGPKMKAAVLEAFAAASARKRPE